MDEGGPSLNVWLASFLALFYFILPSRNVYFLSVLLFVCAFCCLSEDEEDHPTETSSSAASNRNPKSISSTPSTAGSSSSSSRSEKGGSQSSSNKVQVSTERWFSQPMFSDMGGSDESMLPSMFLPSTLGEDGVADDEEDDFNPVIASNNKNTQSLNKKEGKSDPGEQEDSDEEEEKSSEDEDRSEVIRELDDSALPQVPLSEKQRKRKQRAALEEKKAKGLLNKKRKRTDGEDLLGAGDELEDESDRTGLRGKTRYACMRV